ncbi:hypothetical protein GW17_00013635 [Ensete ventricosum]|nr:hypothetical protein GW17_00013635 [Ensete ventricosum]
MLLLRTPFFLSLKFPPLPPCLPSLPFSNPRSRNLFLRCCSTGRVAMSGRRTVTDVLMGNARAAAAAAAAAKSKKSALSSVQPEQLSPPPSKKPKTLDGGGQTPKDPPEEKNPTLNLKKKCSDFNPKKAASWKDGEPVPFLFLARALELISNESGRIAITEIICNVFRTVIATTPGDLLATVYLSANRIAAPHEGIELGIGDASLVKALAEAYGRKEEQVKKQLKELGDLGLVAKASRSSQKVMFKPQPLTIAKVFDTFRAIAKVCSFLLIA